MSVKDTEIKIDDHSNNGINNSSNSSSNNTEQHTPLTKQYGEDDQLKILRSEKCRLKKLLEEKTEHLRKLRLVKMYREKSDLNDLGELTYKWRVAAQEAAEMLYSTLGEPKPEMREFFRQLQIDEQLIHYDHDGESFY